jgi:hypothetical protein
MNAQLMAALRTGAQLLVSWLVTHVAVFALLPDAFQGWLTEGIVTAVVLAVWVYLVRWLETRTGDGPGARLARAFAAILMLGASKYQPTYGPVQPYRTPTGIAYGPVSVSALPE